MVFFIIYLLSKKSYRPHTEEKLSKAEEEQLIKEWTPLPLVPVRTKAARENLEEIILEGMLYIYPIARIYLSFKQSIRENGMQDNFDINVDVSFLIW